MPEPRPHPEIVLAVFADLLDADAETVVRRLQQESDDVAREVRLLLDDDASSLELEPDDFTAAVTALVSPEQVAMPASPAGFELQELIGRGAMGEVYHAIQHSPRRSVALKFVDGDGLAEAQALVDARHPSIPEVYVVESIPGGAYIAMELVAGVPLRTWMSSVDLDAKLALFEQLCRGVHQIHRHGLLHRDLKPLHVLVDAQGPRLVDFGLAIEHGRAANETVGTAPYLADEVLMGGPASVASEVFALTCILVEMVTGELAMPSDGTAKAQRSARGDHQVPPSPSGLQGLVRRGLGPAEHRPLSAEALADEVAQLLRKRNPLTPGTKRLLRRSAAGLAVVGVLVVVGLAGLQWQARQHERRADAALVSLQENLATASTSPEGKADSLVLFAELAEVTGTQAAGWARVAAADRLLDLGDRRGSQDLLAHVFETGGPPKKAAADRLATGFLQDRAWESLGEVAQLLPDSRRDELSTRAAVGLRDWGLSDVSLPPIIEALAGATATDLQAREISVSNNGYLAFERGRVHRGPLVPTLAPAIELGPSEVGGRRLPFVVNVDGPMVLFDSPNSDALSLRRPTESGWLEVADVQLEGQLWSATAGDLNGDGVPTVFAGTAPNPRQLRALEPPDWIARPVDPDLDNTASDFTQLEVADLDGDGVLELIVALGPWRAHDVRVYHQRLDGSLQMMARVRLGGKAALRVLPMADGTSRLACLKIDTYPNPRLFGDDQPLGKPAGLHVFAFNGTQLVQTVSHPIDALRLPWAGVHVGDLDGDGDVDIIGGGQDDGVIIEMDATGGVVDVFRVDGLRALATADLDGDGDDELLVNLDDDPQVWVLGSGTDSVPRRPRRMAADPGPLERLALYGPAARLTRTRADVEPDAQTAAALYLKSARLFELDGHPNQALGMIEASLDRLPTPAGYTEKSALLSTLVRYPEMATLPVEYRRGPIDLDVTSWDLRSTLPAAHWRSPVALHHVPGDGLEIEGTPRDGVLLSIPMVRTADVVGVEIDVDLFSAEMGVQLTAELVAQGQPVVGTRVHTWGGAQLVRRWTQCTVGASSRDLALSRHQTHPVDAPTHHQARVAYDNGDLACGLALVDSSPLGHSEFFRRSEPVELPERMELVVRLAGDEPAARLAGVLTKLVVTGLVPLPVDESSVRRRVVLGTADSGDRRTLDPLEQLELDAAEGRVGQDANALAAVLSDPRLLAALRRHPDFWIDSLREHHPQRLESLIPQVWRIALGSGSSEATRQHLGAVWMDELPISSEEASAYLLDRATLLAPTQPYRARQILTRLGTSGPLPEQASSWVFLAALEAKNGDADAARAACEQARQATTLALLTEDLISAESVLDGLCAP